MSVEFKEFPFSYRISQGGIVFAFSLLFFVRPLLQQNAPVNVRIIVGGILATLALASVLVSQYVIVRYPFLSLVEASDGDYFGQHITSSSRLYTFLKWISIVVFAIAIFTICFQGIKSTAQLLVVIYLVLMLGFLLFLALRFESVSHPTIATYIRSTIGIGIVLFPFFIPALILGSYRCRRMLEDQEFANMVDAESDDQRHRI